MRITIVGCGSIGSRLAKAADDMEEVKRIYLVDIRKDMADNVAASLRKAIVERFVERFFSNAEGSPHFIRVK